MGILTAKKIAEFYEAYARVGVTFTADMIQATGLIPEHVHIKCGSDFWPCVFMAASFQGAKVLANAKKGLLKKLAATKNSASLRLSFKNPEDRGNPVTFFMPCRVGDCSPYKGSGEVSVLSVRFTQRPPDDFIEIMGRVLDAKANSSKPGGERILVNADSGRRLRLYSRETVVFIQKVPRRCILRDLSFSGAKVVLMGVGKFLADKEVALRVEFEEPRESFLLPGRIAALGDVEGKQEMVALSIAYDKQRIPSAYKVRINDYSNIVRADGRAQSDWAER